MIWICGLEEFDDVLWIRIRVSCEMIYGFVITCLSDNMIYIINSIDGLEFQAIPK